MTRPSPSSPCALVFGLGFTGRAVARRLLAEGWRVAGTGRERPVMAGVEGLVFEGEPTPALDAALARATLVLSAVPPAPDGSDPVLDAYPRLGSGLGHDLGATPARAVIYLSATSVYGDRQGGWVTEAALPRPRTRRGRARAEAELRWLETALPVHVLRLAGIYGPGRSAFDRLERAVVKPGHVVNRIHVNDIAALVSRIACAPAPGLYNVADGHPAPPEDVVRFAARLAGAPPPREVPWTAPELSPMARSFYGETKRVDATRARETFGWGPAFADYRAGLRAIWNGDG